MNTESLIAEYQGAAMAAASEIYSEEALKGITPDTARNYVKETPEMAAAKAQINEHRKELRARSAAAYAAWSASETAEAQATYMNLQEELRQIGAAIGDA